MSASAARLVRIAPVDAETGLGVFATLPISSGSLIFSELPFVAMQHSANKAAVVACAYCFKYFSAATQLVHMEHILTGGESNTPFPVEGVSCGCGERYCSEGCRLSAWEEQHETLCVGRLKDEDPLVSFKRHALEIEGSGDSLLLAGQCFARLLKQPEFPIGSFSGERYSQVGVRSETSDWDAWVGEVLRESHGYLMASEMGRRRPDLVGRFDEFDRLLGMLDNNVVDVVGEVGNVFEEISDHPVVRAFMEEVYDLEMEGVFDDDDDEDEEEISDPVFRKFPEFRGFGLYPTVARINHACNANAEIRFHGRTIGIFAKSEISAGEEIRISYLGNKTGNFSTEQRRANLQSYGFLCKCSLCSRRC